jgi:uncharacterized protein
VPRSREQTRECALTRETKSVEDLVRFVVSPDGVLMPDVDAKAEGRGVWVTLGHNEVAEAVKKNAFAKSLKTNVTVPDDLAGLTQRHLQARFLGALSMTRKAGQIVTGATKVKAAIESGEAVALLTATDAAEDGRKKMAGSVRGYEKAAEEAGLTGVSVPHLESLDSTQLGLALGLENVIHAALTRGAAAQSALDKGLRLARFLASEER